MQSPTFFDIESGPLPIADVLDLKPEFTAPSNWKDPDKIRANILEQEAKWLADGALSAVTGRVLVIGLLAGNEPHYLSNDNHEEAVLAQFWDFTKSTIQAGSRLVGFCCKSFDLPFLVRRSWKLGVPVPMCLWDGRYWSDAIVDVADRWACGGREPRDRISLDVLSKYLKIGAKTGKGEEFAALWVKDREKALAYLKNDLVLTKAAYERLFA